MLAAATLLFAAPATAQSLSQSDLQSRYDRALAAGYKAMFLCSAIANAERNGATRTPESVMEWELAGIQSPLNGIVEELPYEIVRAEDRRISHVSVEWAENSLPRFARHDPDNGCVVLPIWADEPVNNRWFAPNERIIVYSADYSFEDTMYEIGDAAFDGSTYGADSRTTSVIVILNGETELVLRASGFRSSPVPQRTWSVAKSIAATLIGAAVYRGDADVSDSAGLGENRGDPRHEITIDQLLRMASGRYSDTAGNRTDALYFGGATVDEVALDWPLVNEPGTVFRYANNDTLAAIQAIEHTFDDHPPADLFDAIGMDYAVAETDWRGNYILSSQVWATDWDLAILGQLYLNDGVLPDGTRILPEGWVEYVSTPSGPQPEGNGWGYGAGWWLMNNSEGIPSDTIVAAGNRGQYIVVIPSRDVVIVRRGEDPAGGSGFDIEAFTRDVLAALGE
ncbi:serine hydrolase domain-containing protein [Erythrobacter sp. EC-HK427]|uniref:serine hydrolase domain-containing protein n=1 Tax=Erythrobacter sp. EC-HK427 TaxID=2038396 RepID=UPI001F396FD0|nr:serine hydrolase [Erythrobacter sp. EC-HK427]